MLQFLLQSGVPSNFTMKSIVFACIVALACARPEAPAENAAPQIVKILRDDRQQPAAGSYSFDIETEDGIKRSESGAPLDLEGNPTGQQGSISFTFPTGELFTLTFVANEGGFQPQSSWLPVAPEFPHPIPQYVRDQIEKAAREDEEQAAKEKAEQTIK